MGFHKEMTEGEREMGNSGHYGRENWDDEFIESSAH
jgi:hypothetical protein